jgi:hypothetical protein
VDCLISDVPSHFDSHSLINKFDKQISSLV